jgi:DNA-binding MarR family transcriptional regulator
MNSRPAKTLQSLPVYESPEDAKQRTWIQFARNYSLLIRKIAAMLSERGITLPQFDVLATLRFSEGVTQQELAERLLVTKGNVCQVLDRLEQFGWVTRRSDPKDARTNRLHLTAAGRKKIGQVLPQHDKIVLGAMKLLSDGDIQLMRGFLTAFERGIAQD